MNHSREDLWRRHMRFVFTLDQLDAENEKAEALLKKLKEARRARQEGQSR